MRTDSDSDNNICSEAIAKSSMNTHTNHYYHMLPLQNRQDGDARPPARPAVGGGGGIPDTDTREAEADEIGGGCFGALD